MFLYARAILLTLKASKTIIYFKKAIRTDIFSCSRFPMQSSYVNNTMNWGFIVSFSGHQPTSLFSRSLYHQFAYNWSINAVNVQKQKIYEALIVNVHGACAVVNWYNTVVIVLFSLSPDLLLLLHGTLETVFSLRNSSFLLSPSFLSSFFLLGMKWLLSLSLSLSLSLFPRHFSVSLGSSLIGMMFLLSFLAWRNLFLERFPSWRWRCRFSWF